MDEREQVYPLAARSLRPKHGDRGQGEVGDRTRQGGPQQGADPVTDMIQDCPDCGGGIYPVREDGMVGDGDMLPCSDCGRMWVASVDEDDVWSNNS